MQNHVTFETAMRLKEAGFAIPPPAVGQFWFDCLSSRLSIVCENINIDNEALRIGPLDSIAWARYFDAFPDIGSAKYILAPTATDILREFPGWTLAWLADPITNECAWFCWRVDTPALCFTHHTNPAEAAALAWLHEKKNTTK